MTTQNPLISTSGAQMMTKDTKARRARGKTEVTKYLKIRIEQLTQEREKNSDHHTHLILDKSIQELAVVLDYIERKAPLQRP